MTFLLTKPTIIAKIAANIFGLFSITRSPVVFKKIAGKIIAGNIADGTKDKTSLILSVNISFLSITIIKNLEKKVINPQ